jgi:putative aldouronate transport system substrate-binding protein
LSKKLLKRSAVTAISATMALSALAGCSGKDEGKSSDASSTPAAAATTSAAPKEKVTLKVEVFDRGNAPAGQTVTDSQLTKWIQQEFGDKNNIKMEYVPVPRAQEVEKLNVLMASGDAPDIVFTYDNNLVYKYVQQGGLADLGKLIDQYGPNLKKYLGADTLAYGVFDKVQYAIPAKRVYLGKYSSMIRKDWLDKAGLQAPKTTDEVYQVLKAFKEKKLGGDQTIPLGFSLAPASYEPIIWSFIKKAAEEERYTQTMQLGSRDYPVLLPGHKDGLKFLNKLYNEGLISPDFALDKDKKKLQQDASTGKVGFYSEDAASSYGSVIPALEKNIPGSKLLPVDPFTNEEGKHAKPGYAPAGMYIMIPKSSKHAAEAIKYLDWMAQHENMKRISFGVEGTNYVLQDGLPVRKDDQATKDLLFNTGDMLLVTNGFDWGDKQKNLKSMVIWVQENLRAEADQAYQNGLADGIPPLRFGRPVQAEVKNGKALLDKYEQMLVKSMMVKPGEFDSTYDNLLKDFMATGGDDIQKERKQLYQEMKK